jgi:predicted transcriptional regulator
LKQLNLLSTQKIKVFKVHNKLCQLFGVLFIKSIFNSQINSIIEKPTVQNPTTNKDSTEDKAYAKFALQFIVEELYQTEGKIPSVVSDTQLLTAVHYCVCILFC